MFASSEPHEFHNWVLGPYVVGPCRSEGLELLSEAEKESVEKVLASGKRRTVRDDDRHAHFCTVKCTLECLSSVAWQCRKTGIVHLCTPEMCFHAIDMRDATRCTLTGNVMRAPFEDTVTHTEEQTKVAHGPTVVSWGGAEEKRDTSKRLRINYAPVARAAMAHLDLPDEIRDAAARGASACYNAVRQHCPKRHHVRFEQFLPIYLRMTTNGQRVGARVVVQRLSTEYESALSQLFNRLSAGERSRLMKRIKEVVDDLVRLMESNFSIVVE